MRKSVTISFKWPVMDMFDSKLGYQNLQWVNRRLETQHNINTANSKEDKNTGDNTSLHHEGNAEQMAQPRLHHSVICWNK